MSGHRHDRTGAVVHQHVISNPDRNFLARERIDRVMTGRDSCFRAIVRDAVFFVFRLRFLDVGGELGVRARETLGERVLGCEHYERGTVDGVESGGEDADRVVPIGAIGAIGEREVDPGAFRAANPILLERQDRRRPSLQRLHRLEELVSVIRDPEKPLFELFGNHFGIAPPTAPIDHLLVGKHGSVDGTPIHSRLFSVGEVLLPHLDEEPLIPPVVLRVARRKLPLPCVRKAQPSELGLHVLDIRSSPILRMLAVFEGGVFRRQTERVPPDGMKHIESAHLLEARDDISNGVVAHMPHMDFARRVGQHFEAVVLRTFRVFGDFEDPTIEPFLLPLELDRLVIVGLDHRTANSSTQRSVQNAPSAISRQPSARSSCTRFDAAAAAPFAPSLA